MSKLDKFKREQRRLELLKHFEKEEGYEIKFVKGNYLVKFAYNYKNGKGEKGTKWCVSEYSPVAFERYQKYNRGEFRTEEQAQKEHLRSIMNS